MSAENSEVIWGLDLGGTKIEGVVLRKKTYEVVSRLRVPTEQKNGYDHILNQIKKLLDLLRNETGHNPRKLGIGTPGTLDPITQTLKNSNTTCLNDTPFKKDLENLTGLPITIANDANCFALAESKMGVIKSKLPDAKVIFGVIMGTGVGGGLVANGRVINGKQGIGGEWGHNFLDESGGSCYCGKTGCVETVISGTGLEKYYHKISGNKLTLKEIVRQEEADLYARQTLERLYEQFGKGISVIINIVDPDAIILGGGVGNIEGLYTKGVERVKKYVFNNRLDTVFLKPELGDSAGVFGAAMLVDN